MRTRYLLIVIAALFLGLVLRATTPLHVETGTWASAGQMSSVRAGAASVLLPDGRVMIIGGVDASGKALNSAEFFNTDGTFSPAPPMNTPRVGHAAIWLLGGEVLVTGGTTSGGGVTNSVETFDPLSGTWSTLPATLGDARTGHTLAQLADGSVLVIGGENAGTPVTSLETYNLFDENFSFAGTMPARKGAAAAALPDGRVLIAGGFSVEGDGNGVPLAGTLIYDPATGSISDGPAMSAARVRATATTTYDGVAIIGGNDGTNDLGTADIYSQWTNTFRAVAGATPRSGHVALLLPNNGGILVTGGTAVTAVDVLQPWRNNKAGLFLSASPSPSSHDGGFVSPIGVTGLMLAAGGNGGVATNADLYAFPTIATDKSDYAPGTIVVMTGTGFQAGETVTLNLQEWVNKGSITYPDYTVTAEADGSFTFSEYAPTPSDLNSRFHLTAVGQSSGLQAQTVFTDGGSANIKFATSGLPSGVVVQGTIISYTNNGGQLKQNVAFSFNSPGPSSSTGTEPNTSFSYSFPASITSGGVTYNLSSSSPTTPFTTGADKSTTTVIATYAPACTIPSGISISPVGPVSLSVGDPLNLTAAVAGGTGPLHYQWKKGSSLVGIDSSTFSISSVATGDSGTYSVVVSNACSSGVTSTNSVTVNVSLKTTSLAVSSATGTYGGTTALSATLSPAVSGKTINFSLNGASAGIATTNNSGVASLSSVSLAGINAGTYAAGVGASFDGDSTYAAANGTANLTVNKADQTITFDALADKTYGDADFTVNASASSNLAVTFGATGNCDVSGNTVHITGAGNCTITASQAGNDNYKPAADVSQSFAIAKAKTTTLVSCGVDPFTYNGSAQTPCSATVTGPGLNQTLEVTYSDNVNAGTATATASYAETANYLASSDSKTFTIDKAPSSTTVTCGAGPFTYNGTAQTPCSASATGAGALDVTLTVTYTNNINAGIATASASFDGDSNHTGSSNSKEFTINKAAVTAKGGGGSATYDGTQKTPSDCVLTGDYTVGLSCANTPATVGPNAGTTTIVPQVTGANDNFDVKLESGSYEIAKADAAINVTGYTGNYDGQEHGATGTAMGVEKSPADLNTLLHLGAKYTDYPGGTAHWTFNGNENYKEASGDVSITINKASVTATAGGGSATYDGTVKTPSACVVSGTYTGNLSCTNNPTVVGPDAGTTAILPLVSGAGLSNFDVTSVNGSYRINKANATITVTGYDVIWDGQPHRATGTATGVNGTDLSTSLVLTGTEHMNPGDYNDTWSFSGGTNYNDQSDTVHDIIRAWTIDGYYQPVEWSTSVLVWNTVKGGSTVPLKFNILAGPVKQTTTAAVQVPSGAPGPSAIVGFVGCGISGLVNDLSTSELATNTGNTALRYDSIGGQFIQNWQTPKSPGKCYVVRVTAADGSSRDAYFKLK